MEGMRMGWLPSGGCTAAAPGPCPACLETCRQACCCRDGPPAGTGQDTGRCGRGLGDRPGCRGCYQHHDGHSRTARAGSRSWPGIVSLAARRAKMASSAASWGSERRTVLSISRSSRHSRREIDITHLPPVTLFYRAAIYSTVVIWPVKFACVHVRGSLHGAVAGREQE